ncbi:MAG: restriction endonuclease subunit S [Planctomycetia bacterium]|nr:restriction endonuclease subunit S [Planctomycetia bacterium]
MTLETFFEKFELFADAPGAVRKMREMVLAIAIQGKLVPQDPNDEPATTYLSRMDLKSTALENNDASLERFIPSTWTIIKFEDVALVAGGVTLGRKLGDRKMVTLPYLRVANVKRGELDLSVVKEVTIAEDEIERYSLLNNDLLMTEGGDWDKVGRSVIWRCQIPQCLHQNHIFRARMRSSQLLPIWFERYFNSPVGRAYFQSASKQTTNLASINMRQVRACPIPLPPLAEQKRIVAKVDELMALCDRLEAQQEERENRHAALVNASLARFADAPTPDNLQFLFHPSYAVTPADLRKMILSMAVQGKLVPQDVSDAPAEELFDRISKIRAKYLSDKRSKTTKKIRELNDAGWLHNVPQSWIWCRLGNLVLDFRYGTSRKCTRNSNGVPVLRIPNIQSGRIESTDMKYTAMPSSEFEELRLQEGDLLLVRSNGSESLVGRSAVASINDEAFAYAGYLVRARIPKNEIFTPYIQVALSTPFVREQIEGPIRTTSGVKNINTTELSNLVVPLPPLAEQRRIVAKVDQLMALVDQLESQLAVSQATARKLMEAVVGELTTRN